MNRPPPPATPDEPRPDTPWHLRRTEPDDPTRVARPRPRPVYREPPPPSRRPIDHAPQRPPDIPWYLQRPNRPAPSPVEQHKSSAASQVGTEPVRKRLTPWLLVGAGGLAVVIGAVVLIGTIARLGVGGGTVLDVTKVQSGVLQTLSDPASGYGANTVTDVSCNGGRNPSAQKGTTFTCEAIVNGASRHVAVVVSDDRGTYEIDSPR